MWFLISLLLGLLTAVTGQVVMYFLLKLQHISYSPAGIITVFQAISAMVVPFIENLVMVLLYVLLAKCISNVKFFKTSFVLMTGIVAAFVHYSAHAVPITAMILFSIMAWQLTYYPNRLGKGYFSTMVTHLTYNSLIILLIVS